jgi:hypothetical protein
LRWNCDGNVTFNYRLARKRESLGYIFRAQSQGTSTSYRTLCNLDSTTPTAALTTTRLPDINTSQVRSFTQQCACGNAHRLFYAIKDNRVFGHAALSAVSLPDEKTVLC